MARARTVKDGEDVLVKSAEFIGWALGGIEREIAQTRDRLAALNAEAVKLRARIGKGGPAGAKKASAEPARSPSRRQRRSKLSPEKQRRITETTRHQVESDHKGND